MVTSGTKEVIITKKFLSEIVNNFIEYDEERYPPARGFEGGRRPKRAFHDLVRLVKNGEEFEGWLSKYDPKGTMRQHHFTPLEWSRKLCDVKYENGEIIVRILKYEWQVSWACIYRILVCAVDNNVLLEKELHDVEDGK